MNHQWLALFLCAEWCRTCLSFKEVLPVIQKAFSSKNFRNFQVQWLDIESADFLCLDSNDLIAVETLPILIFGSVLKSNESCTKRNFPQKKCSGETVSNEKNKPTRIHFFGPCSTHATQNNRLISSILERPESYLVEDWVVQNFFESAIRNKPSNMS